MSNSPLYEEFVLEADLKDSTPTPLPNLSKREMCSILAGKGFSNKDFRMLYLYGREHEMSAIAVSKKIGRGILQFSSVRDFCSDWKRINKTSSTSSI